MTRPEPSPVSLRQRLREGPPLIGTFSIVAAPELIELVAPVVRVRWSEPALIGAALDAGAAGVLVPHVQSARDAAAVVEAARFPPDGGRGAHPWVRAAGYAAPDDWHARANDDVAVIAMVEGKDGVAAVDEILATPGLDAVFLGPVDLAQEHRCTFWRTIS